MSGPIIRKYGFPNFDQIFGKKELEHGVDDDPDDTKQGEAEKAQSSKTASSDAKPSPPEQAKP